MSSQAALTTLLVYQRLFARHQQRIYRARTSNMHRLLAVPLIVCLASQFARADSVVVFNEIMYHPQTNESVMEWVELQNQLAVDVDLSGWFITGGVGFNFAEGTIISAGGYAVI